MGKRIENELKDIVQSRFEIILMSSLNSKFTAKFKFTTIKKSNTQRTNHFSFSNLIYKRISLLVFMKPFIVIFCCELVYIEKKYIEI